MPSLLFQSKAAGLAAGQIDIEAGVIRKVSIITQGPALGHGMLIDKTTLQQVKTAAESYQGGLKVKMNHGGGVDEIVGFVTNFQIEGDKLVADFHLLNSAPARAYVLEIAQRIPESFGMSIAFSGVAEDLGGVRYARCAEIYSCDLVSEPAANPSGLFGRRFDEWQKLKGHSPEISTHSMENELLVKIGELIDSKLAAVTANFESKLSALKTANEATLSKIEDVSKLSNEAADKAALAAVKEFAKTLGQPAGAAAAPSATAAAPIVKKFEELVKEHPKYATSKFDAMRDVMSKHADAHRDYLARCQKGEIVIF